MTGKPNRAGTGFWASRVDDPKNWKAWCEEADFRKCCEENSFKFTLKPDAKILYLSEVKQLDDLPKVQFQELIAKTCSEIIKKFVLLDYEKLLASGFDAVEMTNVKAFSKCMPGWDCNSIVIMNPKIIQPGKKNDF